MIRFISFTTHSSPSEIDYSSLLIFLFFSLSLDCLTIRASQVQPVPVTGMMIRIASPAFK